MTAAAIASVQARIASIEARFGVGAPPVTGTGSSFAAALQAQLGSTAAGSVVSANPAAAGGSTAGQQAVQIAMRSLGVPYQWGGTDPAKGVDCSGLVQSTFAQLGVSLPRVAADQARVGQPVASLAQAQPGDLVFFHDPVDHVGIYAGGGKMVVAPHTGDVVKIEQITETPSAIRRVVGNAPAGATAGVGAASATPAALSSLFASATAQYGLPAGLLSAVAKVESGYNPSATSPAGAQGLMQLMPSTASSLGVDPMDPAQAVDGAARLLRGQLDRFGSIDLALAAYNAGGGAVARYGGIPPYPETQAYVTKVKAAMGGAA